MLDENGGRPLLPLGPDKDYVRPRREWLVRLLVLVLAAGIFLPNLGAFGLWDPWETHYGEVTRNMVETHDWVSPYWGYRVKIGDQGKQGSAFFSKPVLIFWTEAMAVRVLGLNEWAIRLPMALMALLTVFLTYFVLSRIWNRKAGLLAALAMATAPQFFFLARQAQTDMPFVSMLTVALLFFMLALFGPKERPSLPRFYAKFVGLLAVFLLTTIPQFGILVTDLSTEKTFANLPLLQRIGATIQMNGIYHSIIYGLLTVVFLVWTLLPPFLAWRRTRTFSFESRDALLRRGYLLMFYVFCGHASLGKGLLGFLLPGAILFFFFLVTGHWKVLRALFIPQGLLAFCLTAFPWYLAMFAKHGNGFYARFFIHDHFNRLGTGVHEIDDGTFEHFMRWLGNGLVPWVALVPLALLIIPRLFKRRDAAVLPELFLFLWGFFAYLLFTLASTKFHHYIFPALPAVAMLIGVKLAHYTDARDRFFRMAVVLGLGITIAVGLGIRSEPQTMRNLFTYKYDRKLPQHLPTDPEASASGELGPSCRADSDCAGAHLCTEGGTCDTKWKNTWFWRQTTPSVRWLLTREWLSTELVPVYVMLLFGLGLLLLLTPGFIHRAGLLCMATAAIFQAVWGLNYYLPLLSPHWSQKYVFEDYYDQCGPRLKHTLEDDYRPLLDNLGLGDFTKSLGATMKRVCPDNITSWLIVWRGETYYSYNELMPLEKKDKQLRPYIEEINPQLKTLPASCGGGQRLCPSPFYVFMENRNANSSSSIASQVNDEVKKIRKDGKPAVREALETLDRFEAVKIHFENDFFTLFKLTPTFKGNGKKADNKDQQAAAPECGCAAALAE